MIPSSPRSGEVAAGRKGHSIRAYSGAHDPSAPFDLAQGRRYAGASPRKRGRKRESLALGDALSRVRWCLTFGLLPEDENAGDHEQREQRRDGEATDGETAVGNRL